ncbi:MAG: phosphatase PAP2 family protein [Novosphingobium meiothermophilum]
MRPIALDDAPAIAPKTLDVEGCVGSPSHRASWLVIACGFLIALLVLAASGIGISVTSVGPLLGLAMALVGAEFYYTAYRAEERIAATCGTLATLIAAALLAAFISHASLRLGAANIDAALSGADRALGIRAPEIVAAFAAYPAFARLLGVIYSTAMPVCMVLALVLAAGGRRARASELAFSFTFCIVLAATVSIGFPALGSTVHHGIEGIAGLPKSAGNFHMPTVDYYRNHPSAVFDLAKVEGIVTFPSFHMVMALMAPYALRGAGLASMAAIVWAALVTVSSIVIGGHYVVDLLGGAVTWAAAIGWARSADRKTQGTA